MSHQERQRPANHVGDFSALERATLIERDREQHRKCALIELHTGPVALAAQPLVLVPVTVRILRGEQIPQRVACLARRADRQQRAGAFHQIARPHQVITLALLARVAPRHAQGSHHGTRIGLVLVGAQHHGGNADLLGARLRQAGGQRLFRRTVGMPARPAAALSLPGNRERLRQRGERQRRRSIGAAAKAERQHRLPRQFTQQRDVAGSGCVVFPGECAVAGEVLPAIAPADESRARAAPGVLLLRVDRGEGQPEGTLLRPQQLAAAVLHDRRAVAGAGAAQVWREQRVGAQ